MQRPRTQSSFWTTWLTAWVVLLGAVLPSVSHALMTQAQPGRGLFGAAICSSVKHQATKASPDSSSGKAAGGAHCPFCIPHDGSIGLPPADLDGPTPQLITARAEPFLFLHAPQPLFAWGGAQPRAPPVALI